MLRILSSTLILLALAGCDNWGDYQYESDKFKFKLTFPDGWEVWDKSDDARDFLSASITEKPDAKIELIATKTAPDISVNELYPSFESGGDDAYNLKEFTVEEKGTAKASNGEGRMIKVHWEGDKGNVKGIRFLFIGNRYQMTIRCQMAEDDYLTYEADFIKMVRRLQL